MCVKNMCINMRTPDIPTASWVQQNNLGIHDKHTIPSTPLPRLITRGPCSSQIWSLCRTLLPLEGVEILYVLARTRSRPRERKQYYWSYIRLPFMRLLCLLRRVHTGRDSDLIKASSSPWWLVLVVETAASWARNKLSRWAAEHSDGRVDWE